MVTRYSLSEQIGFHVRSFGNQAVIYETHTGDTHLVNSMGGDILAALGSESLTLDQLTVAMKQKVGGGSDDLSVGINNQLEGFIQAGFVQT